MTELREAVARAICDSTEADIFDDLAEQSIYRAVYLQQADAAIATVMEASLAKIIDIRASAAGNFDLTGSQFEAYDRAVLDIHKALSAFKETSNGQ